MGEYIEGYVRYAYLPCCLHGLVSCVRGYYPGACAWDGVTWESEVGGSKCEFMGDIHTMHCAHLGIRSFVYFTLY